MRFIAEFKKVPAIVSAHSIVGVGKERPTLWGNYFWVRDERMSGDIIRVVNMWAENLETLVDNKTLDDGLVELKVYYDSNNYTYGLVVDKRLPNEWLYNELCFTGSYKPSDECVGDMRSVVGGFY